LRVAQITESKWEDFACEYAYAESSTLGQQEAAGVADLTPVALERALKIHRPKMHHSYQGVQYVCSEYVRLLRSIDCQISS